MPTAISYTTADEGAQYSSYYARPGPGDAPAGGPLPELGVPTAISYTTADEGPQYSSYYVQGGPGSAPAGGPVPELGVPTAISYTDVGLGSYSGRVPSNSACRITMVDFARVPAHAQDCLRIVILAFTGGSTGGRVFVSEAHGKEGRKSLQSGQALDQPCSADTPVMSVSHLCPSST